MISLLACTCAAAKHYENHANLIKLMQFLMGLDDVYQPIRSNNLTREPILLVKTAFAVVLREESYRNVTSIGSTSKAPSATTFVAKAFDNKNYVKKGNKNNKNYVKRAPNPYLNPSTAPIVSFSNKQMLKLLSLIDDKSLSSSVANMAGLENNMIVGTGDMHGGLYLFDVTPLSPDHVFVFPADDSTLDVKDPDMEVEEDPEEEPEEDLEEVIPPTVAPPPGSPPILPPPLSESSSDSKFAVPVTTRHFGCHLLLQAEQDRASDSEEIRRRLRRRDVKRLVVNRVAEAIAKYERNQVNPEGSGVGNAGGIKLPKTRGCTYKTFLGCNPFTFNGTEDAVGLNRWIEKLELVFQIRKCANEDKVKYGPCTFQGQALTWWNCYVHSLGIDAANHIL
nr:hypothetical protein [Tanacetum cinerariifolium]